jgi:hypothetical protein
VPPARPWPGLALASGTVRQAPQAPAKVLRIVFPVAETGFDPVRLSDTYSVTVTGHIFEAPYEFDHLARPVKTAPAPGGGHARDFGRLPRLDRAPEARHLLCRRPGLQGV